jgi:hypothetical protein
VNDIDVEEKEEDDDCRISSADDIAGKDGGSRRERG